MTTLGTSSALAADAGRRLLHGLAGLAGRLVGLLGGGGRRRLLGGLGRLLGVLGGADGLLPLGLAHLGLLVALGHDVGQRGAHHRPLELLRALGALLGRLLLDALLVL